MFKEIDCQRPAFVFIRHGESRYTNEFPDITETGVQQLQQTAFNLENIVSSYRRLLVFSSPAIRAQGSANVFLESLRLKNQEIKIQEELSPFAIYDLKRFLDYSREHETTRYGQMWERDPFFDSPDNSLTEKRNSVDGRAFRFFDRLSAPASDVTGPEIACSIFFTHFEIMINYLNAVYNPSDAFPIETELGPENGEALIFQPESSSPRNLTLLARSKMLQIRFNPQKGRFEKLA